MRSLFTKMSLFSVVVFGVLLQLCYVSAQTSDKIVDITEPCCTQGQTYALRQSTVSCSEARPSDNVEENQSEACIATMKNCCEIQLQQKTECAGGMKLAELKLCNLPTSNIAKACCNECSLGQLQGESQGTSGCGNMTEDFSNSTSALFKNAYYNCCMTAAEDSEKKETCQTKSCEHICKEEQGRVRCECREGFRLHTDNKSCKDIDECLEGTHQCDQTQNCMNTLGAHECPCKDGYEFESSLGSCVVTPQYESKYACEGKTLEIGCSEGFVIKLIRANYGRFLITTCNKLGVTNWDVNCLSTRSLRLFHNRCHMHQSCSILASTSIFGDPCPNTGKYLEAHYQCVPAPTTTTSRPSPPPWFATAHPI